MTATRSTPSCSASRSGWLDACVLLTALSAVSTAQGGLINFDDLPHSGGAVLPVPGDHYASSGVWLSSATIPGLPQVGEVFSVTDVVNEFAYVSNSSSVSVPNLAGARDLGLQDVIFSFADLLGTLAMTSDSVSDDPTFRLLALESTGVPNQYRVLAVDEAVIGFQDSLSVSVVSGFAFAAFQVTTELEGFDDVNFTPVPAPSSLAGLSLVGVLAVRRRRALR